MFRACNFSDRRGSQKWIVGCEHERRLSEEFLAGTIETFSSVSKPFGLQRALAFNGGMISQAIHWVKPLDFSEPEFKIADATVVRSIGRLSHSASNWPAPVLPSQSSRAPQQAVPYTDSFRLARPAKLRPTGLSGPITCKAISSGPPSAGRPQIGICHSRMRRQESMRGCKRGRRDLHTGLISSKATTARSPGRRTAPFRCQISTRHVHPFSCRVPGRPAHRWPSLRCGHPPDHPGPGARP